MVTQNPPAFTLVVDDIGVKYIGWEHALHLKSVIEEHYKCSADWSGSRYIRITLNWDYANRKVHLSMPGYKDKALKQFQHHKPSMLQHSPFECKDIKYGAKKHTPSKNPPRSYWIKKTRNSFRKCAVNSISTIASQLTKPTTDTMQQTKQLVDYIVSQEDAVITYNASDMILAAHSEPVI